MYRTVAMALIALAATTRPGERSLALGLGSGAGTFGAAMASLAPAASPVAAMGGGITAAPPPKPGRGTATPRTKKLTPKGGGGVLPCLHAWSVRRGLGQFLRLFLLRRLNIGARRG